MESGDTLIAVVYSFKKSGYYKIDDQILIKAFPNQ